MGRGARELVGLCGSLNCNVCNQISVFLGRIYVEFERNDFMIGTRGSKKEQTKLLPSLESGGSTVKTVCVWLALLTHSAYPHPRSLGGEYKRKSIFVFQNECYQFCFMKFFALSIIMYLFIKNICLYIFN